MLAPYRSILSRPGARGFAAAGVLARLPIAMFNISFILMVQIQYDSYEMAGRVAAIGIVVWALQTIPTSRLADRFGQAATMVPLALLHATGAALGVYTALHHGAEWILWCAVAIASLQGPLGSLTRARWSHMLDSDEDIHTAFALEGVLDETLFIAGPALATVLATTVWSPLGVVVSTVGVLVGLAVLLPQRSTQPPPRTADAGAALGWRVPAAVIAVAFIALGLGVMFGAFDISTVAFAEEAGRKSLGGVMLGIISAGSFVGGLLYGSRHWRTALWKRTVLGTVALAVGFSALAFAPNLLWFGVIGFVAGWTIAPTLTNCDTVVQRVVRRDQITEGMAWLRIGMGIGVALGAWLAGYLIESNGARAGLLLAGGAAIAMVGLAVVGAGTVRRGTDRAGASAEDAHPPSLKDEIEWVEQPPTPPNI